MELGYRTQPVQQLQRESAELFKAAKSLNLSGTDRDNVREVIRNLAKLATTASGIEAAGELFRQVNARLYLAFEPVAVKKRVLNKIKSGVVTFGDAPPPIDIYAGPTSRKALKKSQGPDSANSQPTCDQQEKNIIKPDADKSIGNVSRGDWRSFEPLIAVIDAALPGNDLFDGAIRVLNSST